MSLFDGIVLGLTTALSWINLIYCFVGVLIGTVTGVLPGIGAITAISMLFPLTYHLDTIPALIMLAGIWYGSTFGGAITSILLNMPGTPANAVTCLDGHPMAKEGRPGVALFLAIFGSFSGGCIGIVLIMTLSPGIAEFGLKFSAFEYFALITLGLVAATVISQGSAIKGLAMVMMGIAFGTVGMDVYTGGFRFNFGLLELAEGISLVPLAMGIFGMAELMYTAGRSDARPKIDGKFSMRQMLPERHEFRKLGLPILRGSAIGSFLGALPGAGPAIAAYMAYAVEVRVAKNPERFGKGAPEGIIAPEAANNAADQTAFIPTLTLGIPGSPTMALMLAALLVAGIAPGPSLISDEPELFWGLIMSFWIGSIFLVILNLPLISVWVKLLSVPYPYLAPAILMFLCIGTYSVSNAPFDLWLMFGFGLMGYVMRVLGFPAAPMLLGFVLGPLMEEHFRRAMLIARGDPMVFLERPMSATILGLTALLLVMTAVSTLRRLARRKAARDEVAQ
ncbi:MAG: tripartite tricarboxylate transporter permease [Rhodobacter sp.]|nr:tripartite tricarboxylate transporter permease [Paracoccaceae bacterium]MCC0077249.1 tripartite tricarboxylate transporter permease [Rhodobacter sp.]